jgi:hypothetical protein
MTVLGSNASSHATFQTADKQCVFGDSVALVGFPNWNSMADEPAKLNTSINQIKAMSGGTYAGVNLALLAGASGGPALDLNGEVVGVIANSPDNMLMPNAFLTIQSINAALGASAKAL